MWTDVQGLGQNEFPEGRGGRTQEHSINVSDLKSEGLCWDRGCEEDQTRWGPGEGMGIDWPWKQG